MYADLNNKNLFLNRMIYYVYLHVWTSISQSAVFEYRDHVFYSLQSCCLVVCCFTNYSVEFSTDVLLKNTYGKAKDFMVLTSTRPRRAW